MHLFLDIFFQPEVLFNPPSSFVILPVLLRFRLMFGGGGGGGWIFQRKQRRK